MKQYTPFLRVTLSLLIPLVTTGAISLAQSASAADGLFGTYFERMTGPCIAGSVLTGFSSGTTTPPYGTKTCTPLTTLLAGVYPAATSTAPAGQAVIGFTSTGALRFGSVNWTRSGTTISYTPGYVGIGTATPGVSLDVVGNIRSTGGILLVTDRNNAANIRSTSLHLGYTGSSYGLYVYRSGTGANSNAIIRNYGTGSLFFLNNSSTPRMTITSTGLVNIRSRLSIGAASNLSPQGLTTSSQVSIVNSNPTIYLRDTDHRSAMIHTNSNNLYFLRGSGSDTETWQSTGSMWPLTLNLENNNAIFGGNIGIRTGSPTHRLHVAGDARLWNTIINSQGIEVNATGSTNDRFSYIDLVGDSTYTDYGLRLIRNNGGVNTPSDLIHRGTGALRIRTLESAPITLFTNNIQRLIVTSTGNVGIGTTTPGAKLDVNGDARINGITIGRGRGNLSGNTVIGSGALAANTTGNRNTANGYQALSNLTTGSNNIGIGYNAQVPSATASNQVRIGNTAITYAGIQVAWTVTSDKRWKDDITPSPLGLNFINALNPVSYVRKNSDTPTAEYGFIAQEVDATLKQFPTAANQGFLSQTDDGYYELRYNDFIAIITKAVQEMDYKIDNSLLQSNEQSKRIEKLETENAQLKSRLDVIEGLVKQ